MIELVLASMCGICLWIALRSRTQRDPAMAARVAGLTGAPAYAPVRLAGPGPFARIGRRFPAGQAESIRQLLAWAGSEAYGPETVRGAQIVCALLGGLLGLMAGPFALAVTPGAALAAFRFPLLMLRVRIKARRESVAAALPEVADLLAVCTEAGLNIALALRRVADRTSGVLGAELRRMLEEVDLGTPRSRALERFAARNEIPDIDALTETLISAERFGTQISASLTSFASDLRAKHRRHAEEQARKAPIKILFPLVFLILPAFVLLTVAPLLLGTFERLGF